MPKKKKPKKKKYVKRPETLQTQFRYLVDPSRFRTRAEVEAAVLKARANFDRIGRSIAGVKIVARWRNPDRTNPNAARWKTTEDPGQSLHEFWETISKRRL
jgi:hypothetical protein